MLSTCVYGHTLYLLLVESQLDIYRSLRKELRRVPLSETYDSQALVVSILYNAKVPLLGFIFENIQIKYNFQEDVYIVVFGGDRKEGCRDGGTIKV